MNEHSTITEPGQAQPLPALWFRILLPFAILALLGAIAYTIYSNPPQNAGRGNSGPPRLLVEALTVSAQDYQVVLARTTW